MIDNATLKARVALLKARAACNIRHRRHARRLARYLGTYQWRACAKCEARALTVARECAPCSFSF